MKSKKRSLNFITPSDWGYRRALPGETRMDVTWELDRVQVICLACGQRIEAVARDGKVKGYCTVAKKFVDFLIKGHFYKLRLGLKYLRPLKGDTIRRGELDYENKSEVLCPL